MKKNFFEITYIFLAVFVLFTGLALFSYNSGDPSYSTMVFSTYKESIHNIFGKSGAYFADLAGTGFGVGAYLIPFALLGTLALMVKLYRNRISKLRMYGAILSIIIFILVFSIMFGLSGGSDPLFQDKASGGLLGVAGATVIKSIFGKIGGTIFGVIFLFLAFLGMINLSMSGLVQSIILKLKNLNRETPKSAKIQKSESVFTRLNNSYQGWKTDKTNSAKSQELKTPVYGKPNFPNHNEMDLRRAEKELETQNHFDATQYLPESDYLADDMVGNDLPLTGHPVYSDAELKGDYMTVGELEKIYEDDSNANLYENSFEFGKSSKSNPKLSSKLSPQPSSAPKHYAKIDDDNDLMDSAPDEGNFIEEEPKIRKKKDDIYHLSFDLLDPVNTEQKGPDIEELDLKADLLIQKLKDFGVQGFIKDIHPGPVVTMFELELAPGIKLNKVSNLENDLALAMSATSIRILTPIPGKAAVGIEIPNPERAMISFREILESDSFEKSESPLTVAFGKDIAGEPYVSDLSKMPHLLVAGTTGSGKSVCVNTLICSVLYKSSPDMVKLVLIDPKMVELSVYEGIPHLAAPVVTDPRKAAAVLNNVVKEMENRYALLASCRVKSIASYNNYVDNNVGLTDPNGVAFEYMPYMVVVVDEFADLMMVAGKEVEMAIARIAQMARAVGIHLILATQRPSVNVITGLIKANMPARISFKVSSKIDSRTIIDQNGAEMLLGKGDSLFIPPGRSDPLRIHGCFISEEEVLRVIDQLRLMGEPNYDMTLLEDKAETFDGEEEEEEDERYEEAMQIVRDKGIASISMIQRYLRIGYNRAARIVEMMERRGVVTSSDGTSRPREYLGE